MQAEGAYRGQPGVCCCGCCRVVVADAGPPPSIASTTITSTQNRYHLATRRDPLKRGHTKSQPGNVCRTHTHTHEARCINSYIFVWWRQVCALCAVGSRGRGSRAACISRAFRCWPMRVRATESAKIGRWSIVKNVIFGAVASKCVTRRKWFFGSRFRNKAIARAPEWWHGAAIHTSIYEYEYVYGAIDPAIECAQTGWFVAHNPQQKKSFPYTSVYEEL